jgi:hypothetical protein
VNGAGEVVDLGNGKRQVRLRFPTASVEIVDHPRYTMLTRGPRFLRRAAFPRRAIHLRTYDAALLRDGGTLHGQLRMHGIQRREASSSRPASARAPAATAPSCTGRRAPRRLRPRRLALCAEG